MPESYHYVCMGPLLKDLFKALRSYGDKKKVEFEISIGSATDFSHQEIEKVDLIEVMEVYIFGIEAIITPYVPEAPDWIDMLKNHWKVKGYIRTSEGFKEIVLYYDSKDRTGKVSLKP